MKDLYKYAIILVLVIHSATTLICTPYCIVHLVCFPSFQAFEVSKNNRVLFYARDMLYYYRSVRSRR